MRRVLWLICAVALTACANHPTAGPTARLQAEVDQVREQFGFPGMTAAYVMSDGGSGTVSSGMADIEKGLSMKDNSRMLSASTGKSFVAALCIALALEGRLRLDDSVSRWLGKYDWFVRVPNHDSMTLRHLLTHSAGIPDHVHLKAFEEAFAKRWAESENPFPPESLVAFILDKPALFPAGAGWAYSDTGYILAGLVVEAVTGRAYYDEIRERFINPSGLSDTSPSDRRDLPRLAAGYTDPDNPFTLPVKTLDDNARLYWHPGVEWTGGGLVSTSRDLARWGAALFTGKAIPGDYLPELLRAVAVDANNSNTRYGAGVAIFKSDRYGPVYGHAGWIPGYISSFRYYPDLGVTVAFQINTDSGIIGSDENILGNIEERLVKVLMK